jgi:hypothetical protein
MTHRSFSITAAATLLAVAALAGCGGGSSDAAREQTTTASKPPPTLHGRAAQAAGGVRRLERALRDGDVVALCRPGSVFTRAVIKDMYGDGVSCEAQVEATGVLAKPPRLTVTGIALERDLARAEVRVGNVTDVPLELVRGRSRWLVSFSEGDNPIVALEQ